MAFSRRPQYIPNITVSTSSNASGVRFHLFLLSILSLSLSIFLLIVSSSTYFALITTSTPANTTASRPIIIHHFPNVSSDRQTAALRGASSIISKPVGKYGKNHKHKYRSPVIDFLSKELEKKKKNKKMTVKIGLLQEKLEVEDLRHQWEELGETTVIEFDRVSEERVRWKELFPEWIDEEEKWKKPSCPRIPMPRHEDYGEFDVIVASLPCTSSSNEGIDRSEGIRDVFMLQVNLVVANLVVKNGRDQGVYVVFMGSSSSSLCGPMWEIFRCDDLLMHHHDDGKGDQAVDEFWVYKPELKRLKQKVLMPVGTCQLAVPPEKNMKNQGSSEFKYDFSKLVNPIDHQKVAYVTILHSSEAYVCGAIALAQSIIQTNSTKDLVLLADKSITEKSREALRAAGWKIKHIERIRSPYAKLDAYNEWNYSKLRIWQLTEYDKVIFIDSDLIILKNIDDFFTFPQLSAAGNDKVLFNSGIMLIEPSKCVFQVLMKKRHSLVSYNGGDQGFLNEAFTWWHRWPTRLNYLKVYENVKNYTEREIPQKSSSTSNSSRYDLPYAIHYLGLKPWMCYKDYDCNWDMKDHHKFASDSAHRWWWDVYDRMPKKLHAFCGLSKKMDGRIKKWRERARLANLADGHWKIKVKDPRQYT